jgi:hypothetical protein
MKYRVEVNIGQARKAYFLMRGDEIIAESDSAFELREMALVLIGRENSARVVNEALRCYQSIQQLEDAA